MYLIFERKLKRIRLLHTPSSNNGRRERATAQTEPMITIIRENNPVTHSALAAAVANTNKEGF